MTRSGHRPVVGTHICADCNSRRRLCRWLQGISRESPGKSEPGCKPFIWLVVINPATAKALGLTIPDKLLALPNAVIE
jgi:hypothetical protein